MTTVNTANDFMLGIAGKRICPIVLPIFKTRQQAWRFLAWLESMAELLPEEDPPSTMEEIRTAIRNT